LIRDSRINGTIAVLDASKVELSNSIQWTPNGNNYPALIANAPIDDLTSSTVLSESSIGFNLNPASSPYLGVSNTNGTDNFPSAINGAIVSTKDILLGGQSALTGPIMSNQLIRVTSTNLTITFPSDLITNPPPGFCSDPARMRWVSSSVQTVP
jgi:hypothetical protein